ncbi:hypothetical protein IE53DRAFT_383143 [Violaceomyces palustris]|uniref:Uncharacterized protein n=1 Tax=Violaceomyces palustris TaxID=1673888 RepID=A0ACD0P8C1_9BASI|nr:hypothetical protein IE53DRAFT_383143 [Violaceomyces palustris]
MNKCVSGAKHRKLCASIASCQPDRWSKKALAAAAVAASFFHISDSIAIGAATRRMSYCQAGSEPHQQRPRWLSKG